MFRTGIALLTLVPMVFLLSACDSPESTSTDFSAATPEFPSPTATAETSATQTTATQELSPTAFATAIPENGSVATSAPAPTATPTPAPMRAPTPTATPGAGGETSFLLRLPEGFRVSMFTPQSIGPLRFMAFSPDGIMFVTLPQCQRALSRPGRRYGIRPARS